MDMVFFNLSKVNFVLFILAMALPTYAVSAHVKPNNSYEQYMQQLIKLSKKNPRYPFAAMIINNKTGKILCHGVNSAFINPTYHGEMVAINSCAAKYPKLDWSNTTLITDAEPCAMCTGAIIWAGIPKIVYGTSVPFFVKHHWNQIGVRASYIIKQSSFYKGSLMGGVLHEETDRVFAEAYKS
jgi:tRNA(Arg) A34 adenosine deaminase TadA